jgi:hypothetical protein
MDLVARDSLSKNVSQPDFSTHRRIICANHRASKRAARFSTHDPLTFPSPSGTFGGRWGRPVLGFSFQPKNPRRVELGQHRGTYTFSSEAARSREKLNEEDEPTKEDKEENKAR